MEKLTSLAALRVGDLEKVQRLEAELEKAATHRHSYEEKGRRYRDSMEERLSKLQKHNAELESQRERAEQSLQERTEELKGTRHWVSLSTVGTTGLPCVVYHASRG